MAGLQELLDQMRTDKTRAAGDEIMRHSVQSDSLGGLSRF
jgi:hypothetical protein